MTNNGRDTMDCDGLQARSAPSIGSASFAFSVSSAEQTLVPAAVVSTKVEAQAQLASADITTSEDRDKDEVTTTLNVVETTTTHKGSGPRLASISQMHVDQPVLELLTPSGSVKRACSPDTARFGDSEALCGNSHRTTYRP